MAILAFLFVVTAPVSEEVLYRGLFVAWLRRVGWRDCVILIVGSVIFGANHIIPVGFVWGVAMAAGSCTAEIGSPADTISVRPRGDLALLERPPQFPVRVATAVLAALAMAGLIDIETIVRRLISAVSK